VGDRVVLAKVPSREDIVQMITRVDKYTVELNLAEVTIKFTNSDGFFNQDVQLTAYGSFVQGTHGLLGQTWNNATYTDSQGHKHVYQGSVTDYLIQEEDVFGDDFLYNRFTDSKSNQ